MIPPFTQRARWYLQVLDFLITKKPRLYPSFRQKLPNYVDQKVVIEGTIITSQDPGTALTFALKFAQILVDEKTAQAVKKRYVGLRPSS